MRRGWRRKRIFPLWGWLGLVGLVVLTAAQVTGHTESTPYSSAASSSLTTPHTLEHAALPANQVNLSLAPADVTWYAHPVYDVTNRSDSALHNITVWSWTGHILPLLYIGRSAPQGLYQQDPLATPPFDLQPGESIWFVAPDQPAQVTVMWTTQGQAGYVDLRAP